MHNMLAKCVDVANPIVSVLDGIPYIRVIFFLSQLHGAKTIRGGQWRNQFRVGGEGKDDAEKKKIEKKKKNCPLR